MHLRKLNKLLFELSRDSRTTTKQLGKMLRTSQQSASYMLRAGLKRRYILGWQLIIDPARFGMTNVLVLCNYNSFDAPVIAEMLRALQENPSVTAVEEGSLGADLLIEYCVPNLSFFNKQNREFLYQFKSDIRLLAVYPVIVKHLYQRKYLNPRSLSEDIIVSGDREYFPLTHNQKAVLKALHENPKSSLVSIARSCSMDTKTVVKTKRYLEHHEVIIGYTIVLGHQRCGIMRSRVLIQLDSDNQKEVDRFITFCRLHRNIVSVAKLIGNFEFLVTIEQLDAERSITNEVRRDFKISDYQLIMISNQLKRVSVPEDAFM